VSRIAVYMEGGGQTGEPNTVGAKTAVRDGMGKFLSTLRDRARAKRWYWKIVPCGDRASTKSVFLNARAQEPDTFSILLVDAETAVASKPRAHLKKRDNWDLAGVPEEDVHLMAQVMETWFVADSENVKAYYGKDFNEGALPKHAQPESVSKSAIEAGLEKATQKTKKGRYHKIRHGGDLLARIAPDTVKPKCPHCKRLFDSVEALLA
jgi:Domain of unknown function (DUF4276)